MLCAKSYNWTSDPIFPQSSTWSLAIKTCVAPWSALHCKYFLSSGKWWPGPSTLSSLVSNYPCMPQSPPLLGASQFIHLWFSFFGCTHAPLAFLTSHPPGLILMFGHARFHSLFIRVQTSKNDHRTTRITWSKMLRSDWSRAILMRRLWYALRSDWLLNSPLLLLVLVSLLRLNFYAFAWRDIYMTAEIALMLWLISGNLAVWTVHVLDKVLFYWVAQAINSRFCAKLSDRCFCHAGAHPDGHQHGVSIQIYKFG